MQDEDHGLLSLPDGPILEIFDKLMDAKTLIRCSAVCKRFAFLVSQTDTVSLPITGDRRYPSSRVFKNKFKFAKNLKIEFPHGWIHPALDFVFVKWKALYDSQTHIDTCVIFICNFAILRSDHIQELDTFVLRCLQSLVKYFLQCVLTKVQYYLFHRFSDLELLSSVLISNPDHLKFGKLFINKEEILKSRSWDPLRQLELPTMGVKLWNTPVLDLQLFGSSMRRPVLFVVRPAHRAIDMERDVKIVMDQFDDAEEDKIFDEAVMAMMNNENKKRYEFKMPPFSLDDF